MNIEEVKEQFNELYEKIKTHIEINGLQDDLNVEMKNNVIVLHMSEAALFDSGRDDLKPAAVEMLPSICEMFVEYDRLIETIFVNDELSAARAVQVKRFMKKVSSINPAKVWPTGLGEYYPIADNDTEAGKARNRRVDFVVESILKDREELQ
jgi:chemotaxis protein MotB